MSPPLTADGPIIPAWHWIPWITGLIALAIGEALIIRNKKHTSGALFHVLWTLTWVAIGVVLGVIMWALYGDTAGSEYYASYLLANMLSIDNLAVLSAVLTFFGIAGVDRHRPIYWGITGAVIFRAALLLVGVGVATHIQIAMVPLGLWLGYTAVSLMRESEFDAESSFIVKFLKKRGWLSTHRSGDRFILRDHLGKLAVTVTLVAVVVIETADIMLGFDSLAATVAVTKVALIAFVSNVAAVFGLRAMFFVFEELQQRLWALKYGVSVILIGVAAETIASPARLSPINIPWFGLELPTWATMAYVVGIFVIATGVSLAWKQPPRQKGNTTASPEVR